MKYYDKSGVGFTPFEVHAQGGAVANGNLLQTGFTLIETVVAISIFSLIIYGISALVSAILINSSGQANLLSNNDSARRVAFTITDQFRNAQASATGGYPLAQAADQQIIFYTRNGNNLDRIRYYLQSGALYRGVVTPTGNPLTYNLGNEVSTLVQKDIANGVNPIFYYYDGDYNGTTGAALAQPVNVTVVKFVKVNLSIYKRLTPTDTATYTVTASGSIRNLKTNLGN